MSQHKIVNIFLTIIFSIHLGAQMNCLIETVLLRTHNICFCYEMRKLFFCYALLPKGLNVYKKVFNLSILMIRGPSGLDH